MPRATTALLILLCSQTTLPAHEPIPRNETTYTIAAPAAPDPNQPILRLNISTPARFTLLIDEKPYIPATLNANGIRFTSIHTGKKQNATLLYARGTGPVECTLPSGAKNAELTVIRGLETLPFQTSLDLTGDTEVHEVTADLQPWSNLRDQGWLAADEHLHYERSEPAHDADWFTMLAADGLDLGLFMILKGGNVPGLWAQQYAYGEEGRIRQDGRHLIPGEEFRGTFQGHNNLHGIAAVITPVSVGGMSTPPTPENWPTTYEVLKQVTATGGIGGPAHGGTFGKASTAIRDAVLGASEFFELANSHLYELDPWYRLLNCGYLLPPVAGTDLPNFPWRTSAQPFFGETRTYVRVNDPATATFDDWKTALRAGRSFITSGPLISLTIDGHQLGDSLTLSSSEKTITLTAELAAPHPLISFEIIQNGKALTLDIDKSENDRGIHRWEIHAAVPVTRSSWFAARGSGERKDLLWARTGILQRSIAHTAAIPVLVGDQPLFESETAASLIADLTAQREVYATIGKFPDETAKEHTLALFDDAIKKLTH